MTSLRRNTLQLTVASVGQKALAFFYFMLLARSLGAESTGSYFLALSITTMFSVLTDFGLQPVLIREVAKERGDWREIVQNTISLKLILVALSSLSVIVFVHVLGYSDIVRELTYIALAVMAMDAVSLTMFGILRGSHVLLFESIGMFVGQTISVMVGVFVLLFHFPLVMLIVALFCGSFFNAVFSTAMVVRKFDTTLLRLRVNKTQMKRLLKVALPFALAGIFVKIYSYVDTLVISKFFNETEVGFYAVAYKLTYAFQFIPLAFVAALYPTMSTLIERKEQEALAKIFHQAMVYMMLLATPIVLGIFSVAQPLIDLAVGEAYVNSVPVLSLLIFVLFAIFLDFPIGSLLNASDKQKLKTTLMGITMVINVITNFLFVPWLGILGAAISANISFAFLFLSGCWFVRDMVKIAWLPLVSVLMRILLAGVLMMLVVHVLLNVWSFLFVMPVGAIVYLLGLFFFHVFSWKDVVAFRRQNVSL